MTKCSFPVFGSSTDSKLLGKAVDGNSGLTTPTFSKSMWWWQFWTWHTVKFGILIKCQDSLCCAQKPRVFSDLSVWAQYTKIALTDIDSLDYSSDGGSVSSCCLGQGKTVDGSPWLVRVNPCKRLVRDFVALVSNQFFRRHPEREEALQAHLR